MRIIVFLNINAIKSMPSADMCLIVRERVYI